jgi:hypothetical protein
MLNEFFFIDTINLVYFYSDIIVKNPLGLFRQN